MHYYEYWGCNKAPFDNVPDPTMYVSCHTSAHTAISETLFAIEEGNECLAVIVGDVGLGKTMSLRMVMDSLQPGKYQIAFVVNPDMSFVQLLKEIVGQLTGEQCEIKKKMDLLETFNRLLFESAEQGKKVVIFIDEANAMSAPTLEKMRLLTNLQPDEVNLFTIVMAGQIEFAKRLAHPKRANLFQRVGTYGTLEKIESPAVVKSYVENRLFLAGCTRHIFTDDAIDELFRYSEDGVPRLINKISKLSLKAGETNGLDTITGDIVSQIGDRFLRVTDYSTKRRPPKPATETVMVAAHAPEPIKVARPMSDTPRPVEPACESPMWAAPESETPEPTKPAAETPKWKRPESETPRPAKPAQEAASEQFPAARPPRKEEYVNRPRAEEVAPPAPTAQQEEPVTPLVPPPALDEEVKIDQYGVNVNIPADVISESQTFSENQCVKLAGLLAAQTIQKHPRLTATWGTDPLVVWSEIREVILARLRQAQNGVMH